MMQPRQDYEDDTGQICKLERNLYGLKQTSRYWHERFTEFLRKRNLKPSKSYPCVFTSEQDKILIFATYINDELIAAANEASVKRLLKVLRKEFKVTTGI